MNKDSKKYTALVIHDGQYQFRKVPLPLQFTGGFQRYISEIVRNMMVKGIALPHLDDLIIPAKDVEDAIQKLKFVLK